MVQRHGQVIRLKKGARKEYVQQHRRVWPEVLARIKACRIERYSIFLKDDLLFAYFEYSGSDFERDMRRMAEDPKVQEWWSLMEPLQDPLPSRREGEWWANMEEVFHLE
jgi:L-rhamnose mutarotase